MVQTGVRFSEKKVNRISIIIVFTTNSPIERMLRQKLS